MNVLLPPSAMQYPSKPAPTDAPVTDLIKNRWSPVAFDPSPLTDEEVSSLFEAARWAPSSFNEQPWCYVYAGKTDAGREKIESLLAEGNAWAKNAGLLIVSFGKKVFARNGKPNRHALHDTGAASTLLTLQATSMGLVSHQMAGFDVERANGVLGVPVEYEPGSMIAIGNPADPATLPEDMQKRDSAPRTRNERESFAFLGLYGTR